MEMVKVNIISKGILVSASECQSDEIFVKIAE